MQIRADTHQFIESFGWRPMLSEFNSFPVSPDLNAVENCLKAVEEGADIFVLIVGGRYGSIADRDKSVTNLEYLRARAKGIPVYAFVQQSILDFLPVWKRNPEQSFEAVVDSPKLFEFVAHLRDTSNVWVFPFRLAQDISDTLRKQLAYLFMDGLQLRRQIVGANLSPVLSQLQGLPLRLVIEKPVAWEARLFSEVLAQQISIHKQLRMDLDYGIALGDGQRFTEDLEIFGWLSRKHSELERFADAVNAIVNVALQDALGPPGIPGDPEAIVYAAKRLGELYRAAIQWAIDFRYVRVDEDFHPLLSLNSTLTSNMIREIEEFSNDVSGRLQKAVANLPAKGEPQTLTFTLTVTAPDLTEYYAALDQLKKKRGWL